MRRVSIARGMLAALAAAVAGIALAADVAPGTGPGWTGVTKPKDVIHARQELMEHIEILMEPIDTITVKGKPVENPDLLRSYGEVIAAMVQALPHLFPPTTNLYDPKVKEPATLALPPIWKNFDNFYALAGQASQAAEAFSETKGSEPLRAASLRLRASCDACHALYLRKYEPPKVLPSDLTFDFESAIRKK